MVFQVLQTIATTNPTIQALLATNTKQVSYAPAISGLLFFKYAFIFCLWILMAKIIASAYNILSTNSAWWRFIANATLFMKPFPNLLIYTLFMVLIFPLIYIDIYMSDIYIYDIDR